MKCPKSGLRKSALTQTRGREWHGTCDKIIIITKVYWGLTYMSKDWAKYLTGQEL